MDRILRILPAALIVAILTAMPARGLSDEMAPNAPADSGPDLTAQPRSPGLPELLSGMPLAETSGQSENSTPFPSPPPVSETSSPLLLAATIKERSEQLEQVAQQADRRIRHGFELAGRGAYFAARTEFIGALRLVAEGIDTEQKTNVHGRALATALVAIKEAEDFLPAGSRLEADLDLPGIIAVHRTPVLNDGTDGVTPMVAMRCYLTFAQEQFAAAVGREVAGSMALHAMGKLHSAMADKKVATIVAPESKAMAFYQAALLAYPKNHMAANDLGVLLARCGYYTDARRMLQHSLALSSQATGWQNLAVVYRQLGQTALADQATRQAALLGQGDKAQRQSSVVDSKTVRWLDPQSFAQTSTNAPSVPGATQPAAVAAGSARPSATQPMRRPVAATASRDSLPEDGRAAAGPHPSLPDAQGPAPTPAAAQRMTWGARTYR